MYPEVILCVEINGSFHVEGRKCPCYTGQSDI